MWEYLKPDWNGTRMMWLKLKLIMLNASWIELKKMIKINPETMIQTKSETVSLLKS